MSEATIEGEAEAAELVLLEDADPGPQPMSITALRRVVEGLHDEAHAEWERLEVYDRYLHGDHNKPLFSPEVERAYGDLWRASTVNYMPLVVNTLVQRLAVDGYRASRDEAQDESTAWQLWQANGLDGRQHKLYLAAMEYGYAYCSVLPAVGAAPVRIRPWSPRQIFCQYEDPDDDWPMFVYKEDHCSANSGVCDVQIWDATFHYSLSREHDTAAWELSAPPDLNAAGVAPFIKFKNVDTLDDDRPPMGEIQPLIHMQDQLNRITFIINLIGEKTSFTIKWMMGVEIPKDPKTGKPEAPWQALPGEIWTINSSVSGSNSKVGQFTPDNPGALIGYRDKIRQDLFSLAQIPPHYGENELVNLSADALAAAEQTLEQKLSERQNVTGEAWEQVLRLAAYHVGDDATAADSSAQVWWRDTSPRALSQTADAVLKLQQANVPVEATWLMLPNVTRQDVDEWKRLRTRDQASQTLAAIGRAAAAANEAAAVTAGATQQVDSAVAGG